MEYFGYNKQKKKDAGLSKEDYYAQEANQIVRRVDPRPRFHPIIANHPFDSVQADVLDKIGRASCRERVSSPV